ncbi:hypothetical protein BD560DRAFT_406666 [Blakeslea trispora]|nr:hypothetical protein BD560DRAFT_406666 [Blakeslea trispora]
MHPSKSFATRKRTHLKPSQVAVLQETFVNNTLPDAAVRAQLAQSLNVTERTVQIWFQNRRAKQKKQERLSPDHPSLTPNVRTGWVDLPKPRSTKNRPRSSSKPEGSHTTLKDPKRAMSENLSYSNSTPSMIDFPIQNIRIGTWARFSQQTHDPPHAWDLYCYADPGHRQFIWQVRDRGHQFRMEVKYDQVQQIRLSQPTPSDLGQLEFIVMGPVSFSMQRQGMDLHWVRCNDFTEHQQASLEIPHLLQGSHGKLRQSLLELVSQSPELASKLLISPRTFVLSPSATPEPIFQNQLVSSFPIMKPTPLWPSIPEHQEQSPVSPSSWHYLPWDPQRSNLIHAPPTEDLLSSFL